MPGIVSHCICQVFVVTYVPCLLSRPAETVACAVATSNKDQPLLCRRRADGGVNGQNLLPVLECERVLDGLGSLRCCSFDRRRGHRWRRGDDRGHRRGRLVEETLHPVKERNLLLSDGERREGKDSFCRETHCGCDVWCCEGCAMSRETCRVRRCLRLDQGPDDVCGAGHGRSGGRSNNLQ